MASAVIIDKKAVVTKKVYTSDYSVARISDLQYTVKINEVLPFRVRFTNIGIQSYSKTDVPPIGIAVIGLNNYIL